MISNLMTKPSEWQKIDFRLAATVSNLLVMINCSSNFVLYSSLSTKFRRTFRQLFCTGRGCPRNAAATAAAAANKTNGKLTTAAAAPGTRNRPRGTRAEYHAIDQRQTQL